MKRLYRRLMSIWRLVRGSDYLLIAVHRHRRKYVLNMTDDWDIPSYSDGLMMPEVLRDEFNEAVERAIEKTKAKLDKL